MSAIGVDVGGSKLLAVHIADDGSVVDEYRSAGPAMGGGLVAAIGTVFAGLGVGEEIAACGVGIAGLVDHATGVFIWGPHVAGTGVPVREALQSRLGVPVVVANDANAAAVAEHRLGAGRGSEAMLMFTLGTGIGGAMILGGSLYRGRRFAGEFGHTRLVEGAHECDCGRRGCWETEAAGPALERMAGEMIEADPTGSLATALGDAPVSGPAISAEAIAGNAEATALITRVGRAFGQGLSTIVTIFDPDRVVIGGGLGSIGEMLLDPIRQAADETRYADDHIELPPIIAADLGERAGAVGAGLLALEAAGDHE